MPRWSSEAPHTDQCFQPFVDYAKFRVQHAAPHNDADQAGDRVGDEQERADDLLEREILIVEHDRNGKTHCK